MVYGRYVSGLSTNSHMSGSHISISQTTSQVMGFQRDFHEEPWRFIMCMILHVFFSNYESPWNIIIIMYIFYFTMEYVAYALYYNIMIFHGFWHPPYMFLLPIWRSEPRGFSAFHPSPEAAKNASNAYNAENFDAGWRFMYVYVYVYIYIIYINIYIYTIYIYIDIYIYTIYCKWFPNSSIIHRDDDLWEDGL